MTGTKGSGRPGGNPDLKKYQYVTDREEPLRARFQIRLSESNLEALKQIPHYQEKVREAIREMVESAELEQTQLSGPGNEPKPPAPQGD